MLVLGVGYLSESSVALVRDGKVLAAISEERLNREKLWYGIPRLSIDKILDMCNVSMDEIDCIATYGQPGDSPCQEKYEAKAGAIRASSLDQATRNRQLTVLWDRFKHETFVNRERTPGYVASVEEYGKPVCVYDHHTAHAAAAYFASGWHDCYILTADGWGDEASSKLFTGKDGQIQELAMSNSIDSLGYFYGSVTKSLGFTPHRHEGKVLGLAAYGDASKCGPDIADMISYDTASQSFIGHIERGLYRPRFENPVMDEFVKNYTREDVAAAAQNALERVVLDLVKGIEGQNLKIALAGGIFANVKLNQRIAEASNVSEIFVFPNMGDGGLSVGSAWLCEAENNGLKPAQIDNVYWGTEYCADDIKKVLDDYELSYTCPDNLPQEVARRLAEENVVARFGGRMEFGPRALGNRSILYHAADPSVNTWLNQQLQRSEFMPFAPMTMADFAEDYYVGLSAGPVPVRFMTMTVDCTEKMKSESPAAVHVDGTARPQLVRAQDNSEIYAILEEYRQRTGIPTLINTSFNMHEEPIVCTPGDAVRAFLASELPYMAIGPYLVSGRTELDRL